MSLNVHRINVSGVNIIYRLFLLTIAMHMKDLELFQFAF